MACACGLEHFQTSRREGAGGAAQYDGTTGTGYRGASAYLNFQEAQTRRRDVQLISRLDSGPPSSNAWRAMMPGLLLLTAGGCERSDGASVQAGRWCAREMCLLLGRDVEKGARLGMGRYAIVGPKEA
jgi:hypothetical protein